MLIRAVMLAAILAIVASLALWWNDRKHLVAAQRELQAVRTANDVLKKTLGEMMSALAAKDKQIDDLRGPGCNRPESVPRPAPSRFPMGPVALTPEVETVAVSR
jgi:hypothetical protein